ncbi:MAG: hypothetical protein A3C02_02645 [Candidatus Andersenbacteria bacterium RIFCSPHIGHO2_02_FULL_45_11]|uniref:Uncharacterized protein n=1 Tax=Candidatus Andersenbacteria bacterium RIFCSPHIGHO2_12_FULL_45_11 TaxID=1797281 RepID=A0A1G1X5H9_9BACT|nr:MAG: hypothetical protein A3C02_02645 [Candidatus Andersenbacteria bacterium RIFCSPHIGHO2_02_FULL_45_11]OGY35268.1 MAG: hypothetical protein A3D99_01205 [Candidatus Andersenbacteria bacterium RIFCSPHIGHO2_12_FULL_45_11]
MTPEDKKYFENLLAKQTHHFDESTVEMKEHFDKSVAETKKDFQAETVAMKKHFDETAKEAKEESERHMGVLNEHFKSQVSGVAEQYTSLKDSTDARFDVVEERFDAVEEAQAITNEKLDEVLDILKANQETLIEHDRAVEELQKTR